MYASSRASNGPPGDSGGGPGAVEVHGLDASISLLQLRRLLQQVAPVLQVLAALDSESLQGVALAIFASDQAAQAAVDLFDGYPLANSFLHVKRADSLPNSLINLLFSLEQPSTAAAAAAAAAESQANAAAAQVYLEQQQFLQQVEQRRARQAQEAQREAWDAEQQRQQQQQAQQRQAQAQGSSWGGYDQRQQQLPNGLSSSNGHALQQNGAASLAQQQQLEAGLRHLQLDQQQQQRQQQAAAAVAAAAAAVALPPPQPPPSSQQQQQQQQRPAAMSWASAAAAAPSLASLTGRQGQGGQSVAAALAAAPLGSSACGSGSGAGSDDWQTASGSRGRTGRRSGQLNASGGSGGRASSSVSSGSPRPAPRSSGRRSDDKQSRPGGQDGASPDPTTKLWMGGIDGTASAETVRTVFGRFGPIYDYELQPATHEKGRTDQWGFVNYKRLGDATRAYEALVGEVIPELTGTRKLKLQFRPVDTRRPGSRR